MHKTRDILRLKLQNHLSHRKIARSLQISAGSVGATVSRARRAGLDWKTVCQLDDAELERRLYQQAVAGKPRRPLPNFQWIHLERRRPGVTLELLHIEYRERHPDGYGYTRFCDLYRGWLKRRGLSMRQVHKAGDKLFVDYSGKKPHYIDPDSGERVECELFVGTLGASNYTYAEATRTQTSPDWIASHTRAFSFFGGVTAAVVPDQLKSGVTVHCRYEPGVQRTYRDLAEHYGTCILPARPYKPKDKAKVEVAVQIVQRWVLARLRNQTFFSLAELNARIRELVDDLNDRQMRVYGASRRELFEKLDRPALRPLPQDAFVYGDWSRAKVNADYHVGVEYHYYSVPHALVGEHVDIYTTANTVEIYHQHRRVHSHVLSRERGGTTTCPQHLPKAHRKHLEWSPTRLLEWARGIGPNTARLIEEILCNRPHPEAGYRSCLGIQRLSRRYDLERLEKACGRALRANARSYRHVDSILKNGLDRLPFAEDASDGPAPSLPEHDNVRGDTYYH